MRVIIEVADGQVVGVTADGEAEVLFLDYDNPENASFEFDGQLVDVSQHDAEVNSAKVAEAFRVAEGR